ncbi:MAG: HAMP domain-containing protein [Chloroflexi bacterium]|nr:HAMP domain-containing protein [Chloroflexota bacterium]
MRSLTVKLTLVVLVVSLLGVALVAVFALQSNEREFDRFVREQAQTELITAATTYYETNGSWQGVTIALFGTVNNNGGGPAGPRPDNRGGQPTSGAQPRGGNSDSRSPSLFALTNLQGRVLIPAGEYRAGETVAQSILAVNVALESNGNVIGYVLETDTPPVRDTAEASYIARTRQALGYGAVGAIVVAIFLGVLLARSLTRPLRELTHATEAMAQGELAQEVPVRTQDELGQLTAAFNKMSADLDRSNQLRRQMSADIAHDLRTPLTVLSGYIEAMHEGVLKATPARFALMDKEVRYLKRLVEDLRTLTLADAGELSLNRQVVAPAELLEGVAAAFSVQAEQQSVLLHVTAPSALPPISIDPDRITQLLGNLVSNAFRYTPAGGTITLGATQQNGAVQLSVNDTGQGISADALAHIFDRFYRGDSSRQQDEGESGLGLAIAKSIAEAHGGGITAVSTLGKGTRFTINLPS